MGLLLQAYKSMGVEAPKATAITSSGSSGMYQQALKIVNSTPAPTPAPVLSPLQKAQQTLSNTTSSIQETAKKIGGITVSFAKPVLDTITKQNVLNSPAMVKSADPIKLNPGQSSLTSQQLTQIAPVQAKESGSSAKIKNTKNIPDITSYVSDIVNSVKNNFPGTIETVKQLKADPFSKNANPKNIPNDVWEAVKKPFVEGMQANWDRYYNPPKTTAGKLANSLKEVSAVGNALFTPITALFTMANDVPVVASLVKVISLPFVTAGEAAPAVTNKIIDQLPIDQKSKDVLKPAIGEIASLASMLLLGKAIDVKMNSLAKEYGIPDSKMMLEQAKKLVQDRQTIVGEGKQVNLTPDQVRQAQIGIGDKSLSDLYRELNLTAQEKKVAIKEGINAIAPADVITKITDKPYWAKIKSLFGKDPLEQTTVSKTGGKIESGFGGYLTSGEHTPQDVIGTVIKSGQESTPMGKELIKTAVEAQNSGNNLRIDLGEKKIVEKVGSPEMTKVYRTTEELTPGSQVFTNKSAAESFATPTEPVREFLVKTSELTPNQLTSPERVSAGLMDFNGTKSVAPEGKIGAGKYGYVHNLEKAPKADVADKFGQKLEPAGKYMNLTSSVDRATQQGKYFTDNGIKNMETGVIDFKNPLVIDNTGKMSKDWKAELSQRYDGKTGIALSQAIIKDGYDGIITTEKGVPSETVHFDKLLPERKMPNPITEPKSAEVVKSSVPETPIAEVTSIKDVKTSLASIKNKIDELTTIAKGIASVAQEQRAGLNTKDIAQLKRVYKRSPKFQAGDIQTIRNSNSGPLLNRVIEDIRIKYPNLSEQDALDYALNLPNKANESVKNAPELKSLRERKKSLDSYLELLKKKEEELLKQGEVAKADQAHQEWQTVLNAQEDLAKVIDVPRYRLPVETVGKEKTSQLETRVKEALANISPELKDKLGSSTFNEVNKKENIALAVEYVLNNPDDAIRVLTGEIQAPKGILVNAIYIAMEKLASTNVELGLKLASVSSTRMGQEISILSEINPNSPVKLISDIIKFREASVEKRYGTTANKQISRVAKEIKKSVKTPSADQWKSFIDSIEC